MGLASVEKGGGEYFDDADIRADGADDGDKGLGRGDVDGHCEIRFLAQDNGQEPFCQRIRCVGG